MNRRNPTTDPNFNLKVCEGLEELRRNNKSDIRESQVEMFEGLSKVLTDINKYLFTVATALIPIMFSFITITEFRRKIDQKDGDMIGMAIIYLFASIFFGFLHMVSELEFFKKSMKEIDKKLKLWSSTTFWPSDISSNKIKEYITEYDSIKIKVDEISQKMEMESTNIFLILQGTSWLIGILLITIVLLNKLP